jgi:predicted enzyme related to lactoylglutathione lyase
MPSASAGTTRQWCLSGFDHFAASRIRLDKILHIQPGDKPLQLPEKIDSRQLHPTSSNIIQLHPTLSKLCRNDPMKKTALIILAIAASFGCGFAFRAVTGDHTSAKAPKKVTGIGGIFFKCNDPKQMREWYKTNLGLTTNQYGAVFEWFQGADSTKKGFTSWSVFNVKTKYFEPSTKEFMINYRVENLAALIADLKKSGVRVVDSIESVDYGKFAHIMDPEGNKIELWEPNDIEYEKLGARIGAGTTK